MEFIEGDASRSFPDAQAVVITDELSRIIFGDESAMGKILKGSDGNDYHVSAVVRKPQQNSVLQFKAMFSFDRSSRSTNWTQWSSRCFLKFRPGADAAKVGALLTEVHQRNVPNYAPAFPYLLHPLAKYHLYAPDGSETGMKNVRLFVLIAIALLSIACINYVNMVTARIHKRMKEMSLRKVVGAKKFQLFMQTINESIILFLSALLLAQALLFIVMPYFCAVTGKQIDLNPLNVKFILLYLFVFLFITVTAGLYPAVSLSSFKPLDIFNKNTGGRQGWFSFRRVLVVFQFACSAAFIFATIVISLQQHFMATKDMGYQREHTFTCRMPLNKPYHTFETFKHDLLQQPEIVAITASEANIMNVGSASDLQWNGKPDDLTVRAAVIGIDRDLMQILDIQLAEGRGFNGRPADSLCYLLNETAVRQMGISDPLNTSVFTRSLPEGQVTGVVKDFHFRHMTEAIGPVLLYLPSAYWTVYIKTTAGKTREALAVSERTWKTHFPDYPFDYTFMDETFASMYAKDISTGRLFNAFAVISILISCLGLFSLVTYTAEAKTKEIGIRKVLGAGVPGIVKMLTKEFLILVGIAMLIAFPVAYYLLEKMLQNYVYRITISWWMFASAALITIVLTVLTVGWKAFRAATANPVNAIKSE
jgi:ABC-type antimicrobial peptide transport system permease subunit